MSSLWGEEFSIPETKKQAKKIINKIKEPKEVKVTRQRVSKSTDIKSIISEITTEVYRILGNYKDSTQVIRTKDELVEYIDKAIQNGSIAIDTETNNSLVPLTCKIMGACIYTPGCKNAYIPINHVDINTKERLDWQLTEKDIADQFSRLSNTKIIMHNGKFDYEVIKCTCGIELSVYWDTLIGARILNENELANLKTQYRTKIDPNQEKYDIEHLFKDVPYEILDPELFALYAATDSYMTYKLYEWQLPLFYSPQNKGLLNIFMNVEMPVLIPTAEMELNGVTVDKDYCMSLGSKYHKQYDEINLAIEKELSKYSDQITKWRLTEEANYKPKKKNNKGEEILAKSKNEQLEDPVKLSSNTQLAILLYDILGVDPVFKKRSKSEDKKTITVDEEAINQIYEKTHLEILNLLIQKRKLEKLLGTYVDKIPECVLEDGKLHASYNQIGADTGRYSSSNPNMQNIPSRGEAKCLRMMFKASPGCVMVGSDFSAQEPRLLATYSQDQSMLDAYYQGKDLYAVIAQKVYNNKYEDNLEHHADGSDYPDGKARRSNCKSLLLGIMYGRGAASIAEQIGSSIEEAQKIVNDFYNSFPKVKQWVINTELSAKKTGYVEDLWGRRRRLPDIQLPEYSISFDKVHDSINFNPLLFSSGINPNNDIISSYKDKLNKCKSWKDRNHIISEAKKDGVSIRDNGGFISRAERQCVNARIQGGAASMSKRAMIALYNDAEMKELGFKLLIMVHDELIGECPKENLDKVSKKLAYWMGEAGKPEVSIPMKCDVVSFGSWYEDEYSAKIMDEKNKMLKKGYSMEETMNYIYDKFCECSPERIDYLLSK